MAKRARVTQLPLIPYQNPLASRVGEGFFAKLPRTPGVYLMYGLANNIIYVGKAKNLRARLASYRRARPQQVSRKVIRLIHVIDEIKYESCETEAQALLRENELLRLHRPVFNVVNTNPEGYYFVGVRLRESRTGSSLEFRLTTNPEFGDEWQLDCFFGAFKGRRQVRESYQSLLRLLWASQTRQDRFEIPGGLLRKRVPYKYEIRLAADAEFVKAQDWVNTVHRYLKGDSEELLQKLTEELLTHTDIPAFYYRSIQEDLERLKSFFDFGPARNRRIQIELKLAEPLIAQDKIDDYLVLYKERLKLRF